MPSEPAPAALGNIPLFEPDISGNEWKYVKDCLDTGWVSSVGAYVERFEAAIAARVGCRHAVTTTSGTAALHIALLVAGVEPDDEVIVSALTFVAPANAIRYVGAHPVFVDAEPRHWQMDPRLVERFVTDGCQYRDGALRNKTTGRRVRAILPVHVLGHPCDMDPIAACARRHGLAVVEDASESLGASYYGRPAGRLGDIACFSFNGSKIVTSGGGGMITTNNEPWARRARYLTTQAKEPGVEYVHNEIGYNYRLTNLQAAVGLAQIEQLDRFIRRKHEIAATYNDAFSGCDGVMVPQVGERVTPSWWLFTIAVDDGAAGSGSRVLLARLAAEGIESRPLWQPIFGLPPFRNAQTVGGDVAERLCRGGLSLPSSTTLTSERQQRVIAVVRRALAHGR